MKHYLRWGDFISSVFVLDKKTNEETFKNNFVNVAKIFQNLTADEQIDLIDWIKDILTKKVKADQKDLANEAMESFKKGELKHEIKARYDNLSPRAFPFKNLTLDHSKPPTLKGE